LLAQPVYSKSFHTGLGQEKFIQQTPSSSKAGGRFIHTFDIHITVFHFVYLLCLSIFCSNINKGLKYSMG
jgi:hypothetical protein